MCKATPWTVATLFLFGGAGCLDGDGHNQPPGDPELCADHTPDTGLGDLDDNGDGVLTDEDLAEGEAAAKVVWTLSDGTEQVGLHRTDRAKVVHCDGLNDCTHWAVWFRIECDPEAALFPWFVGPESEPLDAGDHDIWVYSYDLPAYENGGSDEDGDGNMLITNIDGDFASGHLVDPVSDIDVLDYVLGDSSGRRVRIEAFAFSNIPGAEDG